VLRLRMSVRTKPISRRVFSKMILGSLDWPRRQFGAQTIATLFTSIFVTLTTSGRVKPCTNVHQIIMLYTKCKPSKGLRFWPIQCRTIGSAHLHYWLTNTLLVPRARPDCNWTTKFRSQRTSHMEASATNTTVTGFVGERLQSGAEDAPVLDRPAPLRRLHDSCAGCK